MFSEEVVRQLGLTREDFKAVYPVLYCSQHQSLILSGRHRARAGWENRQAVDVESWAKRWNIPHDAAHEVIRDRLNVQRTVSKEERAESVAIVAKALSASGVRNEDIVTRVSACFPQIGLEYVRSLVPSQFKDPAKQAAGKKGKEEQLKSAALGESGESPAHLQMGKMTQDQDEYTPIPRKHKYVGSSRRLSESTRRADTPAENELQNLLSSIRGVTVDYNRRIPVEGPKGDEALFADALIDGWLALEVEDPKGSASYENAERDAKLIQLGKRVVHLANRRIKDPDYRVLIAQLVVLCHELGLPRGTT